MTVPALISGGREAIADLETLAERAATFAGAAIADNTRLAYRKAFRTFTTWCGETGFDPLPAAPATVGLTVANDWNCGALTLTAYPGGWYRLGFTAANSNAGNTGGTLRLFPGGTADNGGGAGTVYALGGQD